MIKLGPMKTLRGSTLLAVNVALLAGLLWIATGTALQSDASSAPPFEVSGLNLALSAPPALDVQQAYAALTTRPVFHSDRKFILENPTPAAVVETPPPDYELTGYLALAHRPAKVFLRQKSSGSNLIANVGDTLDGWIIAKADRHHVLFRQDQREFELGKADSAHMQQSSTVASGHSRAMSSQPVVLPKPIPRHKPYLYTPPPVKQDRRS